MKRREFRRSRSCAEPLPGRSRAGRPCSRTSAMLPPSHLIGGDLVLRGSSVEAFAASLRGDVLLPGNPALRRTPSRLERDVRQEAGADRLLHRDEPTCGAPSTSRASTSCSPRSAPAATAFPASRPAMADSSSTCSRCRACASDPEATRAYLEAGSLLGQLDHECAAFGFATTAGHRLAHRRRGAHARRRLRPARPALRPRLRQCARLRRRHRGRPFRARDGRARIRICSGACAAAAVISAS